MCSLACIRSEAAGAQTGRSFSWFVLPDPWEAHILCGRLRAEGIPATVSGDQHIIANWPLGMALGGARLLVPASCLVKAQAVLADYHAGLFLQALIKLFPDAADTCPARGSSERTATIPWGDRALVVILVLLGGPPFPTSASRMNCRSCGHRWDR